MTRRLVIVAAVLGASIVVWLICRELPPAVRFWTTLLCVPFPALMVLQTRLGELPADVARGGLYLGSAVMLWVLAGVTALVAATGGISWAGLGLTAGHVPKQLAWAAVITVLA